MYFYFVQTIHEYISSLKSLQTAKPLEQISKEKISLMKDMAANAENLWKGWLRLQSTRLSNKDRNLLSNYNALLKMVIDAGSDLYTKLGKKIYREYSNLSKRVSHLLPAWAITSLSARGRIPFEAGYFDIVVFDEASQCDIASALPLLYRAKQAVIIGDPKQLRHISGLQKGQDQQLLEKYDLIPEYARWAYSYNSLFDLASGLVSKNDIINLRDHHRSHSEIIEFSNQEFYEGNLRVATNYDRLHLINSEKNGIRWINVIGAVKRPSAGGAVNEIEAKSVIKEIDKLVNERNYKGSIGVVTPFRAQANLIRKIVNDNSTLQSKLMNHNFLVDTVHKFQGDERDVMIFSPVVSKNMPEGALGFMRNNGNLFNVAITRARAMLLVVGDQGATVRCNVSYLVNFAKYTQQLESTTKKKISHSVQDLGEEYPTVSNPERVSEWEHILYKALYGAGIKAIPQYQIEKYTLDFALFDGDRNLDIEVDGERYHKNWTGELCRRDQIRNQRLFELGWDVKRFWVYEIRDDIAGCVEKTKRWLIDKEHLTN
jgi:superfamily I DNA and/or RNA helicase/very-short-patch-repair endonuclease